MKKLFALAAIWLLNWMTSLAVAQGFESEDTRQSFVDAVRKQQSVRRDVARAWARQAGVPDSGLHADGRFYGLVGLYNGRLWVESTVNANAAISTTADVTRDNYDADGSGLTLGIWDGGDVRSTHREFAGRVSLFDNAGLNWHATHVAGTMIGTGVTASAQGMAPAASLDSYDFFSDLTEMAGRGAAVSNAVGDLFLSNHSYGIVAGWTANVNFSGNTGWHWMGVGGEDEDRAFGLYDADSRSLDDLCFNAPYYLPFRSAANDRNDGPPADGTVYYYFVQTSPLGGIWQSKAYDSATDPQGDGQVNGGYDTLPTEATAKNIMTVGAVNDAVSAGSRDLSKATMTSFSSWGPTDDGRIKPDIVANGVSLYSTYSSGDSAYATSSGTSMSSPNACGSAALLQELHIRYFGAAARSSRIKALILHTADDLVSAGPDYQTGWGMMNTAAAADILNNKQAGSSGTLVEDLTLDSASPSVSWDLTLDGSNELVVTLCWTDPAGPAEAALDDPTPRLVNDLDVRLLDDEGTEAALPYILNPASPTSAATTGDNTLDNVEQIRFPAGSGTFRLRVSHKSTLSGGSQIASLVVTGISSSRPVARSIAEAVDQPGIEFAFAGDVPWVYQDLESLDGLDAAWSGIVGRNETAAFTASIEGPAFIDFAWRVSSLVNDDYARFAVNGVVQESISGETNWARVTHPVGAGTHTLTWSYEKDQNHTAGSDAAWVDDLRLIYPASPTVILIH